MWHKRDIPQLLSLVETELDGSIKIYGGSEVDSKIQLLNNSTYTPDGYFIQQENNIGTIQYKQMSRFYPSSEKSVLIAVNATSNIGEVGSYVGNDPFYSSQRFTPSTDYKVDKRESGRYFNIKVTMDGATNPQLTTISFDLKGTSRR